MINPYKIVTISGRIATGTTTLAKNLSHLLDWDYMSAGEIQRRYDRDHGIHENEQGAIARPDHHEIEVDNLTKKMLKTKQNLVYEAWLAGFMAQKIPNVFKVLLVCSVDAIRIDRVMNRDKMTIDEAKKFIKKREDENIAKWKKLYGNYNFWDKKYYDLIIDTYSSGPMETLGKLLDKLGYKSKLYK